MGFTSSRMTNSARVRSSRIAGGRISTRGFWLTDALPRCGPGGAITSAPRDGQTASARLPGDHLALDLLEQRRGDEPEDADGDDADEHHVDLQELPRVPDHVADADL